MNEAVVRRALEALDGIGALSASGRLQLAAMSALPSNTNEAVPSSERLEVAGLPDAPEAGAGVPRSLVTEYRRRASEALDRIAGIGEVGEALAWLELAQPARHRWIRAALAGHLDLLWESQVSLVQFQEALDKWVGAHEVAVRDWLAQGAPKTASE